MCGRGRRNAAPAPAAPRQEAQLACPRAGEPRVASTSPNVQGSSKRSRGLGTGRATRAPVTGAPCCRWWTALPSSRCWPCAGRPEKRAKQCASAWDRTRSSCTRRTTARSSRPTGRLPGRTSFFFAQPYRERGLNEHTNGLVRFPKATGKLDPAEPRREPAQQPATQGAGLPDSHGSFQTGVDRGTGPSHTNATIE